MTNSTARLPFFVYGTLRPAQPNAGCWYGRAVARLDGAVFVPDYRLVSNGAFPYALPEPGDAIIGAIIHPKPEHYDAVLARLDQLEGYPSFYDRVAVTAHAESNGREIDCWLYTPQRPEQYADLRPVHLNDWSTAAAGRA